MFAKIKRNFRKILSMNRVVIVLGLLLLQALWLAVLAFSLYKSYYWVAGISFILQLIFALVVISTERNSTYKIGWLLLIFVIPIFGCTFYLIYGLNISNKKLTQKIKKSAENNPKEKTQTQVLQKIKEDDLGVLSFCEYLSGLGYPAYDNSKVKFFSSGESFFPAVMQSISKAQKFILIEMFIIEEGKIWSAMLDSLILKAKQGVKVKIIYDDFACIARLRKKYNLRLGQINENIECVKFNKVSPFLVKSINNRDHRKIIVVDDIAYTGGINISDEYANLTSRLGYWKDHAVRIEGQAVNGFIRAFIDIWNAFSKNLMDANDYISTTQTQSDGIIQPYASNPFNKTDIAFHVYLDTINRATRYLYISTPYLIPDGEITQAICHAARRGVDVKILVPFCPDKKIAYRLTKANFLPLISAGVKIYLYKAGFNHAKTVVCDDQIALCGTPNFDYVSLFLNFECGVFMYKCSEIEKITKEMLLLYDQSILVDKKDLKTGFWGRLLDSLLRTIEMLF